MHDEGFSFLTSAGGRAGQRKRGKRPAVARSAPKVETLMAALAVRLRGSLTIRDRRGEKYFSRIQQRDIAFQAAAEP
jgi:hypothetical protein